MKTKSLLIAAIVMVSLSTVTFAKEDPAKLSLAVAPVKGQEVFKITYRSESIATVKVELLNSKGVIIYSETLNNVQGFILPLNLNGLKYGEYKVSVSSEAGTKTEKFSYKPAHPVTLATQPSNTAAYQTVDFGL